MRTHFHKKLYGHIDQTDGGKYKYKRNGILSNLPYKKPLDSVLILPEEARNKIIAHLRTYDAKYIDYQIIE